MDQSPLDAAPPAQDLVPDEPPRWPGVVGTISLVYAGLLLTCTGCGIAGYFLIPQLMGSAANAPGGLPPTMQPTPLMLVMYVVSFLWLLLLVGAGITTLSRNPVGRVLHLVWAAGSLLMLVWGAVMQFQMQTAMNEWVKQHPDSPFAKQHNPALALAIAAVMTLVFAAYPVFCLVWFGAVKRRRPDFTGEPG